MSLLEHNWMVKKDYWISVFDVICTLTKNSRLRNYLNDKKLKVIESEFSCENRYSNLFY